MHERMKDPDRPEVAEFVERHWHSKLVMSQGEAVYPHEHEGFLERRDGRIVGLVTYRVLGGEIEVLTLNSTLEGSHIGSSLMLNVMQEARNRQSSRVWFTTTNDNVRGFSFFQRLGFRLVAVHPGVVDEARKVKPEIPEFGQSGIRIRDELVFELRVQPFIDQS